ncbi:MAG TPA: hypothetical protein VNW53_00040 [Phenylobacterium sp.]|uniref:hypothetical protein n=1 Tax=Phenylobacterium sp. TaxID=1871053 RepID=UPI002BD4958F|nr:hypothetical protein [Phenylobacterium sp.]HXA37363.1 hypothetical protein [Phenylobacterium sp.]
MDRRRRRPARELRGLLLGGVVLAATAGAGALAALGDAPIRGLLWVAKGADPQRALGSVPTECLKRPADPALAARIEVGRAAFRTPVLLGGQAARAGINCETCHRAGRSNPDFLFPGVSGAPGTADVTSSLFSTHRGNGIDDPKPIPDLSGPKSKLKVAQDPAERKLEPFIHGLVTEEFDGPEPTPATLDGLAAYVRALDPAACPARAREPLTVALLMADARRALAAAQARAAAGDEPTAMLMVASARSRLGLIDERYAAPALAKPRADLRAADRALADIQAALHDRRPEAGAAIAGWLAGSRRLERELAARQSASLFDPARLAQAAKRRLPG